MKIKIFNHTKRLLTFALILMLGAGFFTSCDDDDENKNVVLLSFGPSGVHHGDQIKFVGQNLNKVTAIVLPGVQGTVEISSDEFASQSSTLIELVVPEEAEAGKVILRTPSGNIESKTMLSFEVPVTITSITGEAKPGTNITIKGDKVNWIEVVVFDDGILVTDFVSKSLTELVVTVPMEAKTGFLLFGSGGTEPLAFASELPLTVTLPAVTSMAPSSLKHTENLTLTGTDLDLVTSIAFTGDTEIVQSGFISQSETEIVLEVPATALKGKLTLKQASPVNVITEDELTIILPVGISVSPTPAKPGEDEITITGTDLDLITKIILPGAGEVPSASFTAHSATEIKLNVPATATQGAIEYITIHDFSAPLGVILKLPPTGSFPVLDYYIYKDGLQNGWQGWGGWGHASQDYENSENPADGDKAIKSVFNDPYGAVQIHNTGASNIFAGYNYLVFYVYVQGEDSQIIPQIAGNGDYYPPGFTRDKYHQIVVPLADLQGSGNVAELIIKNNNADAATNNTIVYVDEIGLTVDEPLGLLPDLVTVIYDDQLKTPFGLGGGWGGSVTDANNIEQQRAGDKSIKATFAGGGSGASQFGAWGNTPLSTAGMQYFAFSIYGGSGTDGNSININIKPTTDGSATTTSVTIEAGKWTDIRIPLTTFGSPVSIGEIQFQDAGWSGVVYIDHVGLQ